VHAPRIISRKRALASSLQFVRDMRSPRVLALALPLGALVAPFFIVACDGDDYGASPIPEPGNYGGYDGGSGSSSGGYVVGPDAGWLEQPDAAPPEASAPTVPPISSATPARAPAMCSGGASPAAYVMTQGGTLFSLDPGTLEMRSLGVLACDTTAGPIALSATTSGTAYVLYDDGNLFDVDLSTLACRPTAYQSGQLGFGTQVGLSVGAGNTADRLYAYGEGAAPVLAVSDLSSFRFFQVGAVAPTPTGPTIDLTTDAYGRLFTFGLDGTLYQIDPSTGSVLGADHTGFVAAEWTNGGSSTSLLAYDGQLYLLSGQSGGISRYDVASKSLYPMGALNQLVVGASATPCLSAAAASGPDAGAPEAGSTEGGAAAPANAFSPGDAWMGTYVCVQGLTNLALVVESVSGNSIDARFDFDWVSGSTQGSYELTGTYDPATREATFTPGPWVSQPDSSWSPVGMDGFVDLSGTTFSGNIQFAGCGAFAVSR
jgi:hypothetical protein